MMIYYAHTQEGKENQLLSEHLNNTAKLAESFAIDKYKTCAKLCGLLHDIGKYQKSFQKKLQGESLNIDHAVCGAKEIRKILNNVPDSFLAYPIIGHHSGLPDHGNKYDNADKSVFMERIEKQTEDYSDYKNGIQVVDRDKAIAEICESFNSLPPERIRIGAEFFIRHIYSCLVDADFLDTEEYCLGKKREKFSADWSDCQRKLQEKLSSFEHITALQKSRKIIQEQAYKNIKVNSKVYLLDMPTGSGKTLCSVNLALTRSITGNKKRIIYVIPYTSVVEQTAQTFKNLFPDLTILEHHSNFDFDEDIEEKLNGKSEENGITADNQKKYTENWDIPFIITTNVQFFESIYSNHSSKLRKFHNMADSVLVFDEIHTLPPKWFIPCMNAIAELTENYNSEALLLTATMPDFCELTREYLHCELPVYDLIPDKSEYGNFEKCTYHYLGQCDITAKISNKSTLVVVNKKSTAEKMYKAFPSDEKYYLTTRLTSIDRAKKIEKIRLDLQEGKKIVVFSTSLIEAGVDLDFDEVYRELSGLDSILQSAGRCNREGKRHKEESNVFIFETGEKSSGEIGIKANISKELISSDGIENITKKEVVKHYFEELYKNKEWTMARKEEKNNFRYDFVKIAEEFKLIDSKSVAIVVPCEDIQEELAKVDYGYPDRRKLARYSASVSFYELEKLLEEGVVEEKNGIFILTAQNYYSEEIGLLSESNAEDYIF